MSNPIDPLLGITLGRILKLQAEAEERQSHEMFDLEDVALKSMRRSVVTRKFRRWRGMLSDLIRYGEICYEQLDIYDERPLRAPDRMNS